ncbi:MAG TPA: T9SS type B sorting domain-containing protein, partial [Phaeodactylibacter sp.]|nr:T9SS type B sorting domain-containing protein [Phaeodactylibacter sp.]
LLIKLGDDQFVPLGCEADLQAIINFPKEEIDTLIWTPTSPCAFPCLDTTITPLNQTRYTVKVIDINGCVAFDTITYWVKKDRHVYIPNAFTPNGDGINDFFVVYGGKDVQEVKTFRVFDRWGELLLEHKNFPPNMTDYGWDGKLDSKRMNENVFVFYVEVLFLDGWVERYAGEVVLHR